MATSGSFIVKNNFGSAAFEWTRSSRSIENKTSTISWTLTSGALYGRKNQAYFNIHGTTYTLEVTGGVVGEQTTKSTSGSFILQHEGVYPENFTVSGRVITTISAPGHSYSYTGTGEQTFTVDGVPQPATLLDAPDFNDEENPTITYPSQIGNNAEEIEACIEFAGGLQTVPYRSLYRDGVSYTFNLTDEERKRLRQGITTGNSRPIRFTIRTFIDNKYYYSTITKTFSLIDYEPTANPTFRDVNAQTAALTGDADNTFIRYASNVYYGIGAQAKKEATIANKNIWCGTYEKIGFPSEYGTIEKIDSDTFKYQVTDSRGYTVEDEIPLNIIPYVKLTGSLRVISLTLEGNLTFNINGKYYEGSFGAQNNSLVVNYILKKNGQVVDNIELNPFTQGNFIRKNTNDYTYEYVITGLDAVESDGFQNNYTLQTTVRDKLSGNIVSEEVTVSAMPVFDWGKNDFNFNVPVHFGRGFTSDVGLKTATNEPRTIHIDSAGAHLVGSLSDLGIDYSENNIYSITGTIFAESSGRYYPLPIPTLTLGLINTPAYDLREAARLWIENDDIYITTGDAWGYVRISVVIQYF